MWIEEFLQVCLSFPISFNPSTFLHLEIKRKWFSDGDWISLGSVSHRFIVPACCFLFWNLSSQALQGVFWRSCAFILRFWRGWGFSCVAVLASRIRSGQGSPFLTELTNLPLTMDGIEQCCSPKRCFLYDWWLWDINFVYIYPDGQRTWKVTVNWGEKKILHHLQLFSSPNLTSSCCNS